MGLLPWSFGFMLIITILTWSAVGQISEEALVTKTIIQSVTRQSSERDDKIASKSAAAYQQFCAKTGTPLQDEEEEEEEEEEENAKRSRRYKPRRRLTSKLHVRALFTNEDSGQKETQEKIFRNLLKVLYAKQPLFSPEGRNDIQVQQLFDEVRLKAIDLGPKLPMHSASCLANIELEGQKKDEKQFILFLILKGGDGELFRGRRCHIKPLLSFINMSKKEVCMSVYLAPDALLKALFENEEVVEKILEYRCTAFKKLHDNKENESTIDGDNDKKSLIDILSEEFKSQFASYLPSGIDPQYIDFRVSKSRPKNIPTS
jgi:hypothetical protein